MIPLRLGPSEIGSRMGLLLRAWELDKAARTDELRDMLEVQAKDDLLAEPELGVYLLNGYLLTYEFDRANALEIILRPIFATRGNDRLHRRFVNFQGVVQMRLGLLSDAQLSFKQLEAMSNAAADDRTLSYAIANLGVVASIRLDSPEAVAYYERSRVLASRVGDSRTIGHISHSLAMTYRDLGLYAAAQREFDTALRFRRSTFELAVLDLERSVVWLRMGEVSTAEFLAERAHTTIAHVGSPARVADSLRIQGMIAAERDIAAAHQLLTRALETFRGEDPLTEAEIHEEIAVVALMNGNRSVSDAASEKAAKLYTNIGAPRRAERMRVRIAAIGGTGG